MASSRSRQVALARYYDPATAQFLSRDPAVAVTQSPYGYVGDDPLNAVDPTGLWDYRLHYDLGASGMSPEEMMAMVAANFGSLFPVPGAKDTLTGVGETMHLRPHYAPFWVRVSEMTSTGWKFDARFPHADAPGFIRFNFRQDSNCHLHLDVHANVNGLGWLGKVPGPHRLYMMDAHHYWGAFARNLSEEVQADNQFDALNPS